jgi:hypothetical protein
MSDFIMEQEISTSGYGNEIGVMEGFMQLNAIGAVAECYCEHAAIAAFSQEAGLNVFTESDENLFKRAGSAVKAFFEKVWEWLKAMVKTVINLFTKSKIDRVIAKLEARPDKSATLEVSGRVQDPQFFIDAVEKFGDFIAKANEGGDIKADLEKWTKFVEEGGKLLKENRATFDHGDKWGTDTITIQTAIDWLKKQNAAGIPSSGTKLLKKLDFDKKKVKNGGEGVDNDAVKKIKKAASALAKLYDKVYDWNIKFISKALNEQIRDERVARLNAASEDAGSSYDERKQGRKNFGKETEESYIDNTDGYFFL